MKIRILNFRGHQELEVPKEKAIEIVKECEDYYTPIILEKGVRWDMVEEASELILIPRLMGGSSPPSSIFFIPVTFQNIKKSYYFYSS